MTRIRSVLTVVVTIVAIAAGAALWHRLPVTTDVFAPFDVPGRIGEPVAGRGLSAVVDGLRIGPVLTDHNGQDRPATGIWLIVDGAFEAGTEYGRMYADLLVGPNRYAPTDRVLTPPAELQPGITDRRGWAFDVAPERLESVDLVVFRAWVADGRLDDRLVIDIPRTDPRVHEGHRVDLPKPVRGAT